MPALPHPDPCCAWFISVRPILSTLTNRRTDRWVGLWSTGAAFCSIPSNPFAQPVANFLCRVKLNSAISMLGGFDRECERSRAM